MWRKVGADDEDDSVDDSMLACCSVDDDVDDGALGTIVNQGSLDAMGDGNVESAVVNVPTIADGMMLMKQMMMIFVAKCVV